MSKESNTYLYSDLAGAHKHVERLEKSKAYKEYDYKAHDNVDKKTKRSYPYGVTVTKKEHEAAHWGDGKGNKNGDVK